MICVTKGPDSFGVRPFFPFRLNENPMIRNLCLILMILLTGQAAKGQRFKTRTQTITSYTAVNGVVQTTCPNPNCQMCQDARAAAVAGKTSFCIDGRCYRINQMTVPTSKPTVKLQTAPPIVHEGSSPPVVTGPSIPTIQYQAPPITVTPGYATTVKPKAANPPPKKASTPKPVVNPLTNFAPTPEGASKLMVALARVTDTDVVFDLGCGDGRNLEYAAESGATCLGVEYNAETFELAKKRLKGTDVTLTRGDLFDADISQATVIFLYLHDGMLRDVTAKIRKECKPGTRVVSYLHDLKDAPCTDHYRVAGEDFFVWTLKDENICETLPSWMRELSK